MKKYGKIWFLLAVTLCLLFSMTSQSKGAILSDNFESGNLNLWTMDGRQFGGTNVAEVIDRNGSKEAHLYHTGFSEIGFDKVFTFNDNLAFSFDMEASVTSPYSSTDHRYASGMAEIQFLDSAYNKLGEVEYEKSTSSYEFDVLNPMAQYHLFRIANDARMTTYSTSVQSCLSYININHSQISFVKLRFVAYASEYNDTLSANVWVDNVMVTPEPATLLMLGLGGLALLRKKSK